MTKVAKHSSSMAKLCSREPGMYAAGLRHATSPNSQPYIYSSRSLAFAVSPFIICFAATDDSASYFCACKYSFTCYQSIPSTRHFIPNAIAPELPGDCRPLPLPLTVAYDHLTFESTWQRWQCCRSELYILDTALADCYTRLTLVLQVAALNTSPSLLRSGKPGNSTASTADTK